MAPEADSCGGWALLIGIDTYPHFDENLQLGGCVNDVRIMKDALVRRFGFQEDRIKVLKNMDATRDAILTAFEDLVRWVGKNESVIVHYSGHGSQKPDGPEEDEPDGYDETLVPCDSGRLPRHENRDITDDEIHEWLQRLMARTQYITLIFDCCNSGTAFRTLRVRGLPREERPAGWVPPKPAGPVFRDTHMGSKRWLKNGEGEKCVLFAACRSTEYAHEILVGDPPHVPHGALTYCLVQELMSPDFKGATCTEVFERLRPGVKGQCDQTPQLEGARDRELFGQATVPSMPFVSVLDRKDDRVILEAGATCGLVRDMPWIVYAPGTRIIDNAAVRLGTLSIVSVGVATSEARIVEETQPGAVIPGARAVEGFPRLTVDLGVPPEHPAAEKVAMAIARSTLLARSRPGDRIDARISLRPGTGGGESWVVTTGVGGVLLAPELPCSQPEAQKILVATLEGIADLHRLASVTNPGSGLKGLVDFEILRWVPDGFVSPLRDESGEILFYEGDRLVLEMRNRSSYPLYIQVLDIGLTGRIGLAYPREGSQELLEVGQTHRAGIREGEDFSLYLPPGLDRLPEAVRKDRETLKLIASNSPVELRLLFQSGQRYRSPWKEDWTTVEQTFRLVPKA